MLKLQVILQMELFHVLDYGNSHQLVQFIMIQWSIVQKFM